MTQCVVVICYIICKGGILVITTDKITRILILYYRLTRGEYINKSSFALEYNVSERSVDRDIEDIRIFLSEIYTSNELIFHRDNKTYYLTGIYNVDISSVEIISVLKILISSRAFRKDEMVELISRLSNLISYESKQNIKEQLISELDNYSSLCHNKPILKIHWDLSQCILKQQIVEINYNKSNHELVGRRVSPIGIIFSEFYFYLVAFREDKKYDYPAFYRLDRIESFIVTKDKNPVLLKEKYDIGSMKKCIQFMYAGSLTNVKLKCKDSALETAMDRLPNAKIIEKNDNYTILTVKIFGEGFIRWALSQGALIEILEPIEFREKMKKEAEELLNLYR